VIHKGVCKLYVDEGLFLVLFLLKNDDAVVNFLEHLLHLRRLPHAELVLDKQMGLRVEHDVADDDKGEASEHVAYDNVKHDRDVKSCSLHLILVNLIVHVVLGDKEHPCLGKRICKPVGAYYGD